MSIKIEHPIILFFCLLQIYDRNQLIVASAAPQGEFANPSTGLSTLISDRLVEYLNTYAGIVVTEDGIFTVTKLLQYAKA